MKYVVKVAGMNCHHCERRVENASLSMKGVTKAKASFEEGTVIIESKKELNDIVLAEKIESAGYHYLSMEDKK